MSLKLKNQSMKQPTKNAQKIAIISIFILAILVVLSFFIILNFEYSNLPDAGVYVSEVIDGDTIVMSSGETIRLLCVNTPERGQQGYDEARIFLRHLVLLEEVRLEKGDFDETDAYNRSLKFVYVNSSFMQVNDTEEIFVNKEILRLGYGSLMEFNDGECDILR